jgi:hypothetical protein
VVFPATGRIVRFEPHSVVHEDPEVAAVRNEAVDVERSAATIPAWKRVLVRTVSHFYEEGAEEFAVYDYSGNLIESTRPYLGPIFLAPAAHRMFACGVSSHFGTTHAYLVDETGAVISEIEHLGEPSDCFATDDQKFVVIIYMVVRPNAPTSTVEDFLAAWKVVARVFDFDGKVVARFEADKKKVGFFEANGRRYEVPLLQPAPPG